SRPEGLAWAIAALSPGRQPDYGSRLGELAMPVHLITGERDEKFSAIAGQMRARIPDATHHVISSAGHSAHFEKPDQYAATLEEILREERQPGVIAC
ncbi:MAG: 2-succinyl-6-hydroxy-2,4-cyclohexadiene-1-carboxylate synthase, partial [Chrysiogenetes bacterium]|nr:2-succinyl-6-hydroxy-2,4-cyclohexadiene-1-carboxylate synthase [Chrysiogenetes bacterium]